MNGIGVDPDALVLGMFAGVLLIYFECNRPGMIVPGCAGGLLVLLSLNALSRLSLQYSALRLLALGMLFVLAAVPSKLRTPLTLCGAILLSSGFSTLLRPSAPQRVHLVTAIFVGAGFSMVTGWLGQVALRARRNKRSLPHVSHI